MRLIRRGALVVMAMCVLLLSGCGEETAPGVKLRVWTGNEPQSADPAAAQDSGTKTLLLQLNENLLKKSVDVSGAVSAVAGMAKSQTTEENEDGSISYTFKLRDARWSDGKRVTAEDFVYAWQRLVDPATDSPLAATLEMVQGYEQVRETGDVSQLAVSAKNESTFVVTLSHECTYFLEEVCTATATLPLRQATVEQAGWETDWANLPTNGLYRFSEATTEGYLLEQNEAYYSSKVYGPQSILFRFYDTTEEAWAAYQAKELDFVATQPEAQLAELAQREDWIPAAAPGTYSILFNNTAAPLDDPLVRQALSLAIDRSTFPALLGTAVRGASALVPTSIHRCEEGAMRSAAKALLSTDPEDYTDNAALAREKLEESSYSAGASFPVMEYLYVSGKENEAVAHAVQTMWSEALRVRVTLKAVSQEELETAVETGAYTLAAMPVQAPVGDMMSYMVRWGSAHEDNVLGYANSAFDTLLSVIQGASDEAARYACLHDAEELLLEDGALAPLYVTETAPLLRQGLTEVLRDRMGVFSFAQVHENLGS